MADESPFPRSIKRPEELQIKQVLDLVKNDRRSRVLLLYGMGGAGKTSLVRRMAERSTDPTTEWLDPIDVDDSYYWLLSNLEGKIVESLDPAGVYFASYKRQLSRFPKYRHENISRETIVSYLGRIKESFAECYGEYVNEEEKVVVIVFDTVETIRDTNLRSTLTQWMKALPKSTLFILSGRPIADEGLERSGSGEDEARSGPDPIETDLANPHQGIPVIKVDVGRFRHPASRNYIGDSAVSHDLVADEEEKLIVLSRGQPLWLAFMIDYLIGNGIPEEAEQHSLDYMVRHMPYDGRMTPEGERLHQSFLRNLVAPYRKSDFWHEAIKRLAVVRQPLDSQVWEKLMDDLALPEDLANLKAAWHELLSMPWIRQRGNGRYVTLHDAVAEAFAQRLFPLHDQDQAWRHRIWRRALEIYTTLAKQKEKDLTSSVRTLDEELGKRSSSGDGEIIGHSVEVDALRRELGQVKAARLYYLFLVDFEQGCKLLLEYFERAEKEDDVFIQDLLVLYLQRFLPGGSPSGAFDDVIKAKLIEFRDWLTIQRPDYYNAIGVMLATYLIDVSQPEAALEVLNQLPERVAESEKRCRIYILRGNACLRIPSRVREGLKHFDSALEIAKGIRSSDRNKLVAEAYKERGYYYRNIGKWEEADLAYGQAQDTMVEAGSSPAELDEIASIQTNWAYVKGLSGKYDEGTNLAEAAIGVRRQFGDPVEEAISQSVCGEVYRYARRFPQAWTAYAAAERLLEGRPNWNWLGLIYQEQAICLHQAQQGGVMLTTDPTGDAKRLITNAMDICLSRSIRAYPSALNRAGRIFGHDDFDLGLSYLEKGITEARRLSDSWFLFANLIEYAELCYRAWTSTGNNQYRANIVAREDEINSAVRDYKLFDLAGRWDVLQGHMALSDFLYNRNESVLVGALEHYKRGFPAIAKQAVASSGTALLPGEFEKFEQLFRQLPSAIQADWQTKLMVAWHSSDEGSTMLLARLQQMLARLQEPY